MVKKLKVVDIKEKEELEPMVAGDLDLIEDGLQFLGRQVPTDSGPMDILAVDSDGALTIIELKSTLDEGQLQQGLRYYDWVAQNAPWIANAYKGKKIDPAEPCRLLLVAPEFGETTKRIAKYINIEIDFKEYRCVELADGSRTLICESVGIAQPPEPPKIYTIPEKLARIEDEKVRELCKQAIDEMSKLGIECRPIHSEWISGWYKNKRFIYLGCKKRFFVVEVLQADGHWTNRIRINTKNEWDRLLCNQIESARGRIEQGAQKDVIQRETTDQVDRP